MPIAYLYFMHILIILIVIAVVGFLAYLVNTEIPMQPVYRKVFNFVAAIGLIIWLLYQLGVLHTRIVL